MPRLSIEAADALARAERPLIIAGRGARVAGAREPLEQLADLLGGLLATSAVANGLFAGNPWALGISGGFASPTAAELIAEADVVLGAGAGLNMWTTRHGRLLSPGATVIQIDHDPDAIGAHHRVDVAVVGDVGQAALALIAELGRLRVRRLRLATVRRIADRIRSGRVAGDAIRRRVATSTHIDPRTLSAALDALLPAERTRGHRLRPLHGLPGDVPARAR